MAEFFGFIYALLKAVPVLDKGVRDFLLFYAQKQKEWFYADIHNAIKKAIETGDTSDLQKVIGKQEGPSGHSGATFDDPDA